MKPKLRKRPALHTLYFSKSGELMHYFDTYKFYVDPETLYYVSSLLSLFYPSDNYYFLVGTYLNEIEEREGLKTVYKELRISTPYGRVYIPNDAKNGVYYVQTDSHDLALNLLNDKAVKAFDMIMSINKIPFVRYSEVKTLK
jgi:hypothetical protein